MSLDKRLKIAVIGAGIAGNTTAYLLQNLHDVHLFEKNDYVGGHAHTAQVTTTEGLLGIDTGFIVFNERNYPLFCRLLREWGVSSVDSDMSFSFYCEKMDFIYAGMRFRNFFSSWPRLFDARLWRLLFELRKFDDRGTAALPTLNSEETLAGFVKSVNFSDFFLQNYLLPMGAAIWSTPSSRMLEFPAKSFLEFFRNHGLLSLRDRPQWKTIPGGSRNYVSAFLRNFRGRLRLRAEIHSVRREQDRAVLKLSGSEEVFDKVVMATHADESLRLLTDASEQERANLHVWAYNQNDVALHSDSARLPPLARAQASWNYRRSPDGSLHVSYNMNRLQNIQSATPYVVSLNQRSLIAASKIHYQTTYAHPLYTSKALRTQDSLRAQNGERHTYFAGSYLGYGFHEDAVRSGFDVARRLGYVG